MAALNSQPIVVGINYKNCNDVKFNNGGLVSKLTTCGTGITNLVLIVGYGNDNNGIPYYRVKGSFGNNWGSGGYIRVERSGNSIGTAGIQTYAYTVET